MESRFIVYDKIFFPGDLKYVSNDRLIKTNFCVRSQKSGLVSLCWMLKRDHFQLIVSSFQVSYSVFWIGIRQIVVSSTIRSVRVGRGVLCQGSLVTTENGVAQEINLDEAISKFGDH